MARDPVLVTGASGFIASHIVRELLERGYRVRGTVRDPAKTRASGYLTALSGAAAGLELVRADLLQPETLLAAVAGCQYVIHTASPYVLDVADPQRDLVDPAVNGARSMLEACVAEPKVRRVVLTSSVAAITDEPNGLVYSEADWNTKSSLDRNPYYYSKTQAEKASWHFVETERPAFDLVVINPFYVIGPSLGPEVNTSHLSLIALTNGAMPAILSLDWALVDVRDVALAHVLAMENPRASGRYLVAAETRSVRQVVDLLRSNGWAERYRLPSWSLEGRLGVAISRLAARLQSPGTKSYLQTHLGGRMLFDNSKVRHDLGLAFRDVDQTILDTMEDLDRWGHLGRTARR